jgi:hypothetical protein
LYFLWKSKDPVTKKFLDDNLDPVFGFVKLVRFSWGTAKNKLIKSSVSVEWCVEFKKKENHVY